MSTAAAVLVPGLIEVLLRIGRPLLRRLVRWGIDVAIRVVRRVQTKLKKRFRRVTKRYERATAERSRRRLGRRRSWLTWRRHNWARALAWLTAHREALADVITRAVADRVEKAIPECPADENYARWRACNA